MKTFIVAVVVLCAVLVAEAKLSDEQKAAVAQRSKDCAAATGVDVGELEKARNGEFADDAKLRAHILCMSKKSGFQNEAGEIQKEVLVTKLTNIIDDQATAEKLVTKCGVQKDTPENTALETVKCFFSSSPTKIQLF